MDGSDVALSNTGCEQANPPTMAETRRFQRGLVQATPKDPNPVSISRCLNGWIAQVGCQQVVFETKEKMLSELSRYLDNPAQVEKEYLERK